MLVDCGGCSSLAALTGTEKCVLIAGAEDTEGVLNRECWH